MTTAAAQAPVSTWEPLRVPLFRAIWLSGFVSMPRDGAWPREQVTAFERWVQSGMSP